MYLIEYEAQICIMLTVKHMCFLSGTTNDFLENLIFQHAVIQTYIFLHPRILAVSALFGREKKASWVKVVGGKMGEK